MKQIPGITEVVDAQFTDHLLPQSGRNTIEISAWDDKPANIEKILVETMYIKPMHASFYEFQLVVGELLTDSDTETMVLLNEMTVKAFGWINPVGKKFKDDFSEYTVKGVIKHVCNFAPTVPAQPVCYLQMPQRKVAYLNYDSNEFSHPKTILFKYSEGLWQSCMEKIESLKKEHKILLVHNDEEIFSAYLKSENAMLRLLSVVSAICILICVFGFVSIVSLDCEERRKSIAIRKINGATVEDIMAIFAKDNSLLLVVGALIAFPIGFFIMQRWLESYVVRTSIPVWVYLSILGVMALVIVLSVGWRIWKTSVENPAEVVKTES